MEQLAGLLEYVNAVAALALAAVAGREVRHGGRPGRWAAAAFAALAVVLLISALGDEVQPAWMSKLLVCVLVAFPYLLLRFAASFKALPVPFVRVADGSTAGLVAATLILPSLPEEGARPAWASAYVAAVLVVWTLLSAMTIVILWRGGTDQPTLVRRRARLMSAAAAGMNVLILLAGVGVGEGVGGLAVQGVLLLSLVAFAAGLAPPRLLRLAWRQPEQQALWRATEKLVGATTVSEVTDTLLPHVASIVGGTGAALCDEHGQIVASVGSVPPVGQDPRSGADGMIQVVALSPPFGSLVVATSPLTPFFGREEVGLLHALGALADLSIARCRSGERELESQVKLREAMEEAERANLAKSDFLSRMSHELRTPLNVILGFGQILEMRGSLEPRQAEAVGYILKGGRHLLELINEVLDLSRIESGRMAVSPEPVEIAELVGEAVDLIRPLAHERSIELVGLADGHQHVTADRQRLKQVLLNLLSNAVKYNRDGGEIRLSCGIVAPGRLRLSVADTGPGVPAAMMDRLFEPFQRLGAEQGPVEGTGLGLALSKQLMELMGGAIGVDSREQEGSVFWLELALAEVPHAVLTAPARPAEAVARHEPRLENRRLLLVEDNLANLRVIESVIAERPQLELLPAMTGRLGVELAREHQPDLVLLDQHLPDLSGAEVLHRLKAHPETWDIPVVVVSADATPGQIRRMLDLGAVDYLTKPLDVQRFLRVVDGILAPEESAP